MGRMGAMRYGLVVLGALACLPAAGQALDARVELPRVSGQDLPGTDIQGAGRLADQGLDSDPSVILSLNHRLVRVNPVLRLDWGVEYACLEAKGRFRVADEAYASRLRQEGPGVGLTAQFWIPFTGVAGELGVIQRFHTYRFEAAGSTESHRISRTWMRVGARWRLPVPEASPYLAVSYQRPLSRQRPADLASAPDLASCLRAQGHGQEFEHLWTFGAGVQW